MSNSSIGLEMMRFAVLGAAIDIYNFATRNMETTATNENRQAERLAALRLSMVSGLGPRLFARLVEAFGSAHGVLAAHPEQLRTVPGIGPKLVREIVTAPSIADAELVLAQCQAHGIRTIFRDDEDYPRLLSEIHDPPVVLFCRGTLLPIDSLAVAIVGSRHATNYGLAQAEKLARGLAMAGVTVVSGLARGIDAAAHRGALSAGGRTLAVLGNGLTEVYPPEHAGLAREVMTQGALISELLPDQPPKSDAFPQRNRIITGLSVGLVVVEAAQRSGALISARLAMEQGREVFAVPGRVDNRMSGGCHRLIRDGAKLVETVDDVLEELGPLVNAIPIKDDQTIRHPGELLLNEQENQVLQAIDVEPTTIDAIVARSGLTIQRVLSTLSVLEMRKLIRRVGGQQIIRL
ncbi:MAG TPA: DNA-processing protein DprA [Pirellulaceae bacterium]|nr:DNA-processing protein DprA [Pirellulaceae bacterium]